MADKACVWKIRLFPSLVFTSFFPSAVSLPWPVLSSSQGSVPGFSFPSIFFFLLPLLSAAQFVSHLYENICSYFFLLFYFFAFSLQPAFPQLSIPLLFISHLYSKLSKNVLLLLQRSKSDWVCKAF